MTNRQLTILLVILGVLALSCAWSVPWPAHAVAPASLSVFSVNDRGLADLLPGAQVQIVIELRSDDPYLATLQHPTPAGLQLESVNASAGTVVSTPFVSWIGDVSSTQPINIRLNYRVLPDATLGDRIITTQAQVGGVMLTASTVVRICCTTAPAPQRPPGTRIYLAVLRH